MRPCGKIRNPNIWHTFIWFCTNHSVPKQFSFVFSLIGGIKYLRKKWRWLHGFLLLFFLWILSSKIIFWTKCFYDKVTLVPHIFFSYSKCDSRFEKKIIFCLSTKNAFFCGAQNEGKNKRYLRPYMSTSYISRKTKTI